MSEIPVCPGERNVPKPTACAEKPVALPVAHLEASEWYFPKCHRSVPMAPETARYILSQRQAQGG